MSASHRLRFEIPCPACGSSGVIWVIEDANPPFTDTPRRSYKADEDKFIVTVGDPPAIECRACGGQFPGPK
jgi:hypothetical protein